MLYLLYSLYVYTTLNAQFVAFHFFPRFFIYFYFHLTYICKSFIHYCFILFRLLFFFFFFFSSFFLFFFFSFFFFSTRVSRRDRRPHGSKKIWRIETMKKMMKKARKQKLHPRTCLEEDTARCIDTKTWTWTWTPPNRPGGFLFFGSFLKSSKKW